MYTYVYFRVYVEKLLLYYMPFEILMQLDVCKLCYNEIININQIQATYSATTHEQVLCNQ